MVAAFIILIVRLPRRPKQSKFVSRWRELQKLCKNKDTWPLAIINADSLLDEAMKRLKISGKTMGERMVSAQKMFTDNDAVWHAHKLRNRLAHDEPVKLTEQDVKDALIGFGQALKDLGAL
jgi:hypothetical protein